MPRKTKTTFAKPGWEKIMKDSRESEYEVTIMFQPLAQRKKEAEAEWDKY